MPMSNLQEQPALCFAGVKILVNERAAEEIPALWQTFMAAQPFNYAQGANAYGLCIAGPNGTEYMAAVAIEPGVQLPADWFVLTIPAATFAVFPHEAAVWQLRETIDAIFAPGGISLPHQPVNNLAFFECYTQEFNPHTGFGGMSVWVPVKAA